MSDVPEILGKEGPLSVVWLAAHNDKKVTKQQVLGANIPELIKIVQNPDSEFSLRITSDLMAGICSLQKRQMKYLLAEGQETLKMVRSFSNNMVRNQPAQTIISPGLDEFLSEAKLQIPDIFDLPDLDDLENLEIPSSQEIVPRIESRSRITLSEIPPLTEEQLREEEEIQQRIHALPDCSTIDDWEFPLPPPPPSEMIATSPDQNLVSSAEIQSPPRAESSIIELPETPESIEKKRQVATGSQTIGSLELPRLDESSIRSTQNKGRPRSLVSSRRRRRGLIIDKKIELSDKEMQENMDYNDSQKNKVVPNLFIPSRLVESPQGLLTKPERPLPKLLQKYFPQPPKHFKEEESALLAPSHHEADDFILPPVELGSQLGQDQSAPEMVDDYEDQLPMARASTTADVDRGVGDFPELSITERTIVEEKFNKSLQDMLAQKDPFQFSQLSLEDNKKITAAMFFNNLLEKKNSELIDLDQEPSLEQFNPINITKIEKSEPK